jgi:phosphatidate cytidylyltransferase
MSDDVWRRGRRDDDDDFGPPLFGGDMTHEMDDPSDEVVIGTGGSLRDDVSFGDADTGPLPHWTSPPTGEMPSILNVERRSTSADTTDDLDVWSSFSNDAPVWSDDPAPTGEIDSTGSGYDATGGFGPIEDDASVPVVRRGTGRITIGTDPTDERMGRPMPKKTGRSNRVDPSRPTRSPGRPPTSTPTRSSQQPAKSDRDMPTAVAVGLLIAAAFVGALLFEPWAVLALIVAVLGLGAVEFFDKVTEKGYRPATVVGIAAAVCLPLAAYWVGESALPLVLILAFAAACLTFITSSGIESSPLPNTAITMLGIGWIGLTGSFAALIVSWSNASFLTADGLVSTSVGTDTLFLLALGVVANDVGALFIGSAAGRTPLRQWISPNKTLEGFIGGTVMTVLAMVVVGVADRSDTWNSTGDLIILGLVIAFAAPLGDLTESMFKRNLDIKDFGSIVKGHGGVLDRFDGFLFVLPAVYYLTILLEPWVTK